MTAWTYDNVIIFRLGVVWPPVFVSRSISHSLWSHSMANLVRPTIVFRGHTPVLSHLWCSRLLGVIECFYCSANFGREKYHILVRAGEICIPVYWIHWWCVEKNEFMSLCRSILNFLFLLWVDIWARFIHFIFLWIMPQRSCECNFKISWVPFFRTSSSCLDSRSFLLFIFCSGFW